MMASGLIAVHRNIINVLFFALTNRHCRLDQQVQTFEFIAFVTYDTWKIEHELEPSSSREIEPLTFYFHRSTVIRGAIIIIATRFSHV